LSAEVFSKVKDIFHLCEGCPGPTLEKGQVLEKVHKLVLIFDFNFFQNPFIYIF
jgi:hypothetical protein